MYYCKCFLKAIMVLFFISCLNRKSAIVFEDFQSQQFLFGQSFGVDVFVKLENDTATMSWFYEEKIPRETYADTLLLNKIENQVWISDSSKIYQDKGKLVLITTTPYWDDKPMKIKLSSIDKEKWLMDFEKIRKYYLQFNLK